MARVKMRPLKKKKPNSRSEMRPHTRVPSTFGEIYHRSLSFLSFYIPSYTLHIHRVTGMTSAAPFCCHFIVNCESESTAAWRRPACDTWPSSNDADDDSPADRTRHGSGRAGGRRWTHRIGWPDNRAFWRSRVRQASEISALHPVVKSVDIQLVRQLFLRLPAAEFHGSCKTEFNNDFKNVYVRATHRHHRVNLRIDLTIASRADQ